MNRIMNETLTAKLCKAINSVLADSEESSNDKAGCVMAASAAYGRAVIGQSPTLIQLAVQMVCVSDEDLKQVQLAIDTVMAAAKTRKPKVFH